MNYSSSRQHHLASDLVLDLFSAGVARANTPVLIPFLERVFDVFEVARRHHQYFLVREVDQSGVSPHHLVLLLELLNVAVELLLQVEIVRYRLVSFDIAGKLEEVDKDVAFALLVAV